MTDVAGKVAVITGGASGIGLATGVELARRGATGIVLADVNDPRLLQAVDEVERAGARAVAVHCDVTSDDEVDALLAAADDAFGRVDIVHANAGVALLGPPHKVEMAEWQRVLDINVLGVVRCVRAFGERLLGQGHGHLVVTGSVAGMHASGWDSAPYTTSKFAVLGLAETLALYFRPQGIPVTCVCPVLVTTNFGETARFSGAEPGWGTGVPNIPVVTPEEVAARLVDGIEADQFLVLTHEEHAELLASLRADINGALARQIHELPPPTP